MKFEYEIINRLCQFINIQSVTELPKLILSHDPSFVEFAFRCVCNYDLCNSETTFSGYLSAIKMESFARR